MMNLENKSRLIMAHEYGFADLLAAKVLNQPKLSLWMVLVPVLFVFYLNDWQAYKGSRKTFAENLMVTPKRALDEAVAVMQGGRPPDVPGSAPLPGLPADGQQRLADLSGILIEHYVDLLQTAGCDYDSLVRSAYKSHTNYLLFLNRLNNAEKALNRALQPDLVAATKDAPDIIKTIEHHAEAIRRSEAEKIFG